MEQHPAVLFRQMYFGFTPRKGKRYFFSFWGPQYGTPCILIPNVRLSTFFTLWGPETWPIVYADQKVIDFYIDES